MIKKSTSYRLAPEIQRLVSYYGGASFIEGCVLLVKLLNLSVVIQRLSLEYSQRGYPSTNTVTLSDGWKLSYPDTVSLLQSRKPEEDIDINRLITKLSDIPDGLPPDYQEALESFVSAFTERETPNI